MASDKVLHKIQLQIDDLTPVLELFVDASVQPSVEDCEKLQSQLSGIQENLAVYKYHKQNKELSPSFNLHAKVSEKEKLTEAVKEITEQKIETPAPAKTHAHVLSSNPSEEKPASNKVLPSIQIGINDKFRFINELFAQNAAEYNVALEQLVNLKTWADTEMYLNSLKTLYAWKDNSEVAKLFHSLVKKRFD